MDEEFPIRVDVYKQLALLDKRNKELSDKLNNALKEIEYLQSKVSEWLPGDDIEAYGEWFTLVVEEDNHYTISNNEYCSYRLLDDNYKLSEQMTLEDLKNNYNNVSLEKRLK